MSAGFSKAPKTSGALLNAAHMRAAKSFHSRKGGNRMKRTRKQRLFSILLVISMIMQQTFVLPAVAEDHVETETAAAVTQTAEAPETKAAKTEVQEQKAPETQLR